MSWNFKDLSGFKFNRLTAIEIVSRNPIVYKCLCDCGNFKNVRAGNLRTKQVTSCGCLHKEIMVKRNTKHSMNNTPLHKLWFKIKERCFNKNCSSYKNYGGRGITMCDRWLDFNLFYEDVHIGYEKGLEIDRIINDGNYEPTNFRWVTHKVNTQNTRKTKLSVEIAKEIRESNLPASFFAKKYNTSRGVINQARRGKTWV